MNAALAQNPKIDLNAVGEPGSPVARLIGKLVAAYPRRIIGSDLAAVVAPRGVGDQFASLCFHFTRANEALAPFNWQVGRSGGEPHSTYFLRPIGPSPVIRRG